MADPITAEGMRKRAAYLRRKGTCGKVPPCETCQQHIDDALALEQGADAIERWEQLKAELNSRADAASAAMKEPGLGRTHLATALDNQHATLWDTRRLMTRLEREP